MKFIRTASTRRLLGVIAAAVVVIVAGAAIAVAAAGRGPVPPPRSLAQALHNALRGGKVAGISADITFTNNLIGSSDFTGGAGDPILQGATGRLWVAADGRLRLELQSSNGDSQIVVDQRSFWVSDPASSTVYEGTLPAATAHARTASKPATGAIPSVAQIQTDLTDLAKRVDLTGARPTDVAGQAAYSVTVSPKHDGGLLGSAEAAWDAIRGVPLDIAVYARGNSTPVLELKAGNISYGAVAASDFAVSPPAGDKVVRIAAASTAATNPTAPMIARGHARAKREHAVTGVAAKLSFHFAPPSTLVGLPRHDVALLDWAGTPAALVTYGENLGGIAVIEQRAGSGSAAPKAATQSSGPSGSGLSLPTVSINGATGQELDTALGTVVRFTSGGVAYTVLGSVPAAAADEAARALTR